MRANPDGIPSLADLFAEYGIEAFLESTNALVAVLDRDGKLLSYNISFEQLKQNRPDACSVKDFLSSPSVVLFDEFFKNTLQERTRKQAILEFAWLNRWADFSSLFIPLPEERVLFIAESTHGFKDLEMIIAELEETKRSLAIKETELQAVLAQADEVSHTDALTFLPNRRRIISDLQHEVIFSDRYGTPLAISMLDIDHFKNINDTYGHMVGDEVLRKLAAELRDHIRHPDVIGRFGGEEFLVVLPHSTIKAAAEQAERLCNHVRSLMIECSDAKVSLTVSMGIAQYKAKQEDWQAFLGRADAALYQAKSNGRNQWVLSEE